MTFREYLIEGKKVQGIKGFLGRYEDFSGSLPVLISGGEDDSLNNETVINFEGNTWELKQFTISDLYSQSKFKSIVKKAIEKMLSKDYEKYFTQNSDESWTVDKYTDFIIDTEDAVKQVKE